MFKNDQLCQITHDDSVTADMVRRGVLRPEDVAKHYLRHVITNVVGGNEAGIKVEAHALNVEAGDRLLLCSDGLTEMLTNEAIVEILRAETEPEAACARLIATANELGGRDKDLRLPMRHLNGGIHPERSQLGNLGNLLAKTLNPILKLFGFCLSFCHRATAGYDAGCATIGK